MKLFKPREWGISKVSRDIANYIDFIKVIKGEVKNPESKFNKWKLSKNYFYTIYFTYDIPEEDLTIPEKAMQLRLMETVAPVHRYLDEELGFAECLVPEFNRFFDENQKPTRTFLFMYRFVFQKLSVKWIIKSLLWIGAISTGIYYGITTGLFANIGSWIGLS